MRITALSFECCSPETVEVGFAGAQVGRGANASLVSSSQRGATVGARLLATSTAHVSSPHLASDSPPSLIGPHPLSPGGFGPAFTWKPITAFLLSISLVVVAGCGGGGSGGGVRPDSGNADVPYGEVQISQSTVRGVSGTKLVAYLDEQASGGPWGPEGDQWSREPGFGLWRTQPTVRVEIGATPRQRRLVERAVDLLNDWLPVKNRMLMGEPTSRQPQGAERRGHAPSTRGVPGGDIHVSFRFAHGDGGAQHPYESVSRDPQSGRDVYNIVASLIEVEPDGTDGGHPQFGIIVHELIHALGLEGHVFEGDHPETLMPDTGPSLPDEHELHDIPRIDGEALMTAYSLYDTGETDDDIDLASFGPWASIVPAVSGRIKTHGGTVEFGAEYRSQWIRAWDEGPMPTASLADSTLTGTAVWKGQMIGYTDQGQQATGDAGISVELDSLTGTAAFTDIRTSGSLWGPNLSSSIGVTGNHFAATGSDPRLHVQGQFRGAGHEAATGVLRWEDAATRSLTGAFGVARQ